MRIQGTLRDFSTDVTHADLNQSVNIKVDCKCLGSTA